MIRPPHIWACGQRRLDLGHRTCLMGILNVTPDSFSDGGRYVDVSLAVQHAEDMHAAGADIIDVGGESTRPGSAEVEETEECQRVVPVIAAIREKMDVAVSIDTRKAAVADAALAAGADIINDVTAGEGDAAMFDVARTHHAGFVLMHMLGTPQTMQDNPTYDNVIRTVKEYLASRRDAALEAGLERETLVVDPGIGFGKTTAHNVALLSEIGSFHELGLPVLVGLSRKRFLGELTGRDVDDRMASGLAGMVMALGAGAHIARVHDVRESRDAAAVADRVMEERT